MLRNPFSKPPELENNDNPFQRRISIKEGSSKNNPFLSLRKSEKSKKEESIECVEKETFVPFIFNVTAVNAEIAKDHGWLSRSNIAKDDNSCKNFTDIDENMQCMESFDNCVISERLVLYVAPSYINYDKEITGNGKKDFRKFKKV